MLLGASSHNENGDYDLNSVTSDDIDPGVPHGRWLRALTEAAINGDWLALAEVRPEAEDVMGRQQTIDALIVAAAFNGITRVADATGIPLDDNTANVTTDMRAETGIQRFEYGEKSARYG
jgi:hypothetical protein